MVPRSMAVGVVGDENSAGNRRHFMPAAIPAVCFTDPEVVVVGLTPQEAAQQGLDCISASFPFAANGRAMTIESTDGFVRVVARKDNHLIVGWQAVGAAVPELSTAFVQSIDMCADTDVELVLELEQCLIPRLYAVFSGQRPIVLVDDDADCANIKIVPHGDHVRMASFRRSLQQGAGHAALVAHSEDVAAVRV